jgi:hypothetical protein
VRGSNKPHAVVALAGIQILAIVSPVIRAQVS